MYGGTELLYGIMGRPQVEEYVYSCSARVQGVGVTYTLIRTATLPYCYMENMPYVDSSSACCTRTPYTYRRIYIYIRSVGYGNCLRICGIILHTADSILRYRSQWCACHNPHNYQGDSINDVRSNGWRGIFSGVSRYNKRKR